jgi:hypothetical protein
MDSFGHQVVKIRPKQNANGDGSQCFFFWGRILVTWRQKRKGSLLDFF